MCFGSADEIGVDAVEHQLRSAKHLERSVDPHDSPRQVEEPFTTLAVHCRALEVELAMRVDLEADVELPSGGRGVARNETDRLSTDLHAGVHVAQLAAVAIAERATR